MLIYIYVYILYIFIERVNIRLFRFCIHIQFFKVPFNCNVILVYMLKKVRQVLHVFLVWLRSKNYWFLYVTVGVTKIQRDYTRVIPKAAICQKSSGTLLLKVWSLALQLPGNILEMQVLRLPPRPTESESASLTKSQMINVHLHVWAVLLCRILLEEQVQPGSL